MGQAKNRYLEQLEKQYSCNSDKCVCCDCIGEVAISNFAKSNMHSDYCDYCGSSSNKAIAVNLDEIVEHIACCIDTYWCNPAEELFYDDGYEGEVLEIEDLLYQYGFELNSDELYEDIVGAFSDAHWCKRDYALLEESERLAYGWQDFRNAIKHRRRFTFWSMGPLNGDPDFDHPDDVPVGEMLKIVEESVHKIGLITEIPTTEKIWRVRVHDKDKTLSKASDFASPPEKFAQQPNRMSPAGVSMFYGAIDFGTACHETVEVKRASGRSVSGGYFTPTRPLSILDLTEKVEIPSFWEKGETRRRAIIKFLRQFAKDLSQPIPRENIEHIEYVPTQAFSEYFRFEVKTPDGKPVDGIRYTSSKNGAACYVLFVEHEQCFKQEKPFDNDSILQFNKSSLTCMSAVDAIRQWDIK